MISVPTLYERQPHSRLVTDVMHPVSANVILGWDSMEVLPGAPIRVTVRSGNCVRLEAIQKPDEQLGKMGAEPWWRDTVGGDGPDFWLIDAMKTTDFSSAPDGEWEGVAVGDKIRRNLLGLEGRRVVLYDLFPYADKVDAHLVPPTLGRTPVDFDDLKYWLSTSRSHLEGARTGAPLYGVCWWWVDTPIAQISVRDFGQSNSQVERESLPESDKQWVG